MFAMHGSATWAENRRKSTPTSPPGVPFSTANHCRVPRPWHITQRRTRFSSPRTWTAGRMSCTLSPRKLLVAIRRRSVLQRAACRTNHVAEPCRTWVGKAPSSRYMLGWQLTYLALETILALTTLVFMCLWWRRRRSEAWEPRRSSLPVTASLCWIRRLTAFRSATCKMRSPRKCPRPALPRTLSSTRVPACFCAVRRTRY